MELRTRCLPWLTADERARYEQLATSRLQHEYLAAHALCRATLSRYANVDPSAWRFSQARYGKPRIAAPVELRSLRFNLTRAGSLAMCIVSRASPVGIDVENTSRPVDVAQIARHFFSVHEQMHLAKLAPRERRQRFFELWVLKEAYLKARGLGLPQAPERFTIEIGEDGLPKPLRNWQFSLQWIGPKHVAAAAVRRRSDGESVTMEWLAECSLFEAGVTVVG